MFHRSLAVFALAVAGLVFVITPTVAQPGGKGPGGKGPGGFKKTESEIERLREQVKDLQAKLDKSQGKKDDKPQPPFSGGPFGKKRPGGFPMPGGPGGFGKGPGGTLASLDPDKLKKILQLYDLVYGESKKESAQPDEKSRKKGGDFKKDGPPFGTAFGKKGMKDKKQETRPAMPPAGKSAPADASRSIEERIERLIGELEQLRREVRKK